jgi:CRISPR/Cas system-associated exonuclease Cas4 (RecB family)
MMDGSVDPASVQDQNAVTYYKKLAEARVELGIQTLKTEIWREIKIVKGVLLRMRIDVLGFRRDHKVIVDWKTSAQGWQGIVGKNGKEIVPNAVSFQATSYLIPEFEEDWPSEIIFVVAPLKGQVKSFFYYWSDWDYHNLLNAIDLIKSVVKQDAFPKVRGYACKNCPFQAVCYESPNWKSQYRPRDKDHK